MTFMCQIQLVTFKIEIIDDKPIKYNILLNIKPFSLEEEETLQHRLPNSVLKPPAPLVFQPVNQKLDDTDSLSLP